MTGLLLNLKPHERFLVGNTVLQNGSRRSQLRVVDGQAGILRVADALHPDKATTPLTRAYVAAQGLVVDPAPQSDRHDSAVQLLREAVNGFGGFSFVDDVVLALRHVEKHQYYRALKRLKPLLQVEAALLIQSAPAPSR